MSEALERELEELRANYRDAVLTIGLLIDKMGGKVEFTEEEIADFDASRRITSTPDPHKHIVTLEVSE